MKPQKFSEADSTIDGLRITSLRKITVAKNVSATPQNSNKGDWEMFIKYSKNELRKMLHHAKQQRDKVATEEDEVEWQSRIVEIRKELEREMKRRLWCRDCRTYTTHDNGICIHSDQHPKQFKFPTSVI